MKRFMQVLMVLSIGTLACETAMAELVVNLQASNYDPVTAVWTNTADGTRNFSNGSTSVPWNPVKEVVAGATAVTFDGIGGTYNGTTVPDKLEAAPAPSSVLGGNSWSAEAWVYNPSIGVEEDYFQWGARATGGGRAADLVYGTSPYSGAYVHWANDAGFSKGLPAAGAWHYIAVTYSGVSNGGVESLYVDGVLDRTDVRTLDINGSINMMVGAGFQDWFTNAASLSIGALRLRTEVLTAGDVQATYRTEGVTYGVVPEPSSLALMASALIGLIAYAWRKRK